MSNGLNRILARRSTWPETGPDDLPVIDPPVDTLSLRARREEDQVRLAVRIRHPMETGRRTDAGGKVIPAHFITRVEILQGNELLLQVECGTGVSRNPYFAFQLRGVERGALLTARWIDNLGRGDQRDVVVT